MFTSAQMNFCMPPMANNAYSAFTGDYCGANESGCDKDEIYESLYDELDQTITEISG